MRKIVAIGGGEIGRPGHQIETREIDREIIRLTKKKCPTLLFIPTASGDSEPYFQVVQNYFGKELGCKTEVLYLIKERPSNQQIREKILSADIVYVGGGNTLRMMNVWKKLSVDRILKQAYEKGVVLSGVSAGAICWFKYGNSDSRKIKDPKADLIKVSGLNIISGLLCPHYDTEKDRRLDLKKMMKKTSGISIALDNCCAIEIVDDTYRIISSKLTAKAYKAFWKNGKYNEEEIVKKDTFLPLSSLLIK